MPEYFTKEELKFETFGYKLEKHKVTTEDGYILSLFRVNKKRQEDSEEVEVTDKGQVDTAEVKVTDKGQDDVEKDMVTEKGAKPSVLLVHGLVCSGEVFFLNGDQSLPYLLVEEGYDCWILSFRGAGLSIGHTSLDTNSRKYWDFSFHEVGLYDIPATIDYILDTTGNARLDYIGYSYGCGVLYILLSLKPEYCAKINQMVALAPAPYVGHLNSTFYRIFIAPYSFIVGKMRCWYCRKSPGGTTAQTINKLWLPFCNKEKFTRSVFLTLGSRTGTFAKEQINPDNILAIADASPASTSMKILAHFSQCIYSGQFKPFDHGEAGNLKKYGQRKLEHYDLKKAQIPVTTFYSSADKICPARDVIHGVSELPNSIGIHEITEAVLGHGDILLGKDAPKVLFNKIITTLNTPPAN